MYEFLKGFSCYEQEYINPDRLNEEIIRKILGFVHFQMSIQPFSRMIFVFVEFK